MRASSLVDVDWWRLQPSVQRVAAISVSMADTRLRCGPASHPRLGSSWCMYNQSIPSRKTAVSSQIFEVPWEGDDRWDIAIWKGEEEVHTEHATRTLIDGSARGETAIIGEASGPGDRKGGAAGGDRDLLIAEEH